MLLSHTVFPEVDNVAALKAYAIEKGVDEKMEPSYGDKKEIYAMAKIISSCQMGKPEELYDMVH
jgi:protein SCO1/2